MITPDSALLQIPDGLRKPLLEEYRNIISSFMENRWQSSELSGGLFSEIIYCILQGHATGNYPNSPSKPKNMVDACRKLESNSNEPRSFQILIPRLLPALYEVRNNRNVGHTGGDVDPDFMDSSLVVSMTSWILAELIRVFHNISTLEAQQLVDNLTERRIPLVWQDCENGIRRVLDPSMKLRDKIMVLIAQGSSHSQVDDVFKWTEYSNRGHYNRTINELHKNRHIEYNKKSGIIQLLPPGADYVSKLLSNRSS